MKTMNIFHLNMYKQKQIMVLKYSIIWGVLYLHNLHASYVLNQKVSQVSEFWEWWREHTFYRILVIYEDFLFPHLKFVQERETVGTREDILNISFYARGGYFKDFAEEEELF